MRTFVAMTVLVTGDFSRLPLPGRLSEGLHRSLVFGFRNLTPRSYGIAVCAVALSTHRRIDSTEALPHASSLGERPTACNRRRFSPLRSFLSPSYKDRWDVYTRGGALYNAPMYMGGMDGKKEFTGEIARIQSSAWAEPSDVLRFVSETRAR